TKTRADAERAAAASSAAAPAQQCFPRVSRNHLIRNAANIRARNGTASAPTPSVQQAKVSTGETVSRARARTTVLNFHGRFYGPRIFCCKTAQFRETLCE